MSFPKHIHCKNCGKFVDNWQTSENSWGSHPSYKRLCWSCAAASGTGYFCHFCREHATITTVHKRDEFTYGELSCGHIAKLEQN